MLTDGIDVGKEALNECLIDYDYLRRSGCVVIGEVAPAEDGDADGVEEMSTDAIPC